MSGHRQKISIKPFRQLLPFDRENVEKSWSSLQSAVEQIFLRNSSSLSYEELYRNAYNLVLHRYGESLYASLQLTIAKQLEKIYDDIKDHEDILQNIHTSWKDCRVSILMIRDIVMHMDRIFVPQHNLLSVYDMSLELFRDKVVMREPIKTSLIDGLLKILAADRSHLMPDKNLIKPLCKMLVELGINSRVIYEKYFEEPFLEKSRAFYKNESEINLANNDCAEFLKKAEIQINEERERVINYLDPETEDKIMHILKTELIHKNIKILTELPTGEVALLENDRIDDLRRMYKLFSLVQQGHNSMRNILVSHLKEIGNNITNPKKSSTTSSADRKELENNNYIRDLLNLKSKYDSILQLAFENDKNFQISMDHAFEFILNSNVQSPEFLCLFFHENLRKMAKPADEREIEKSLNKAVLLFHFLKDKDVFEVHYKKFLAHRLLKNLSVGCDIEMTVISQLKSECGYQFISKLEGMFSDMKTSVDTNATFQSYVRASGVEHVLCGIDFSVNILRTGFWPTYSLPNCTFPSYLQHCCDIFSQFYNINHSGRILTWQTYLGTADIRGMFEKIHYLSLSTMMMLILLLFNDADVLSIHEIRDAINIPLPELNRLLIPLTLDRHKILIKTEVPDDCSYYAFNKKFTHKLFRVRISQGSRKESPLERQATLKKLTETRNQLIDATIVRIMKSRRSIAHNILISETTSQLISRFHPTPATIKERLESLIENEFLKRSDEDKDVYNYMA